MAVVVASSLIADAASRPEVLAGIAVVLLFDSYCRGNEGLDVAKPDVIPPVARSRKYKYWAWIIRSIRQRRPTKAGKYDDTVLIGAANPTREWVQKLVALLFHRAGNNSPLFDDLTLGQLESYMRTHSGILAIQGFWLTPHMLRHGAPSTDVYEKVMDTDDVAGRGHWGSESSCRVYKQPGALLKLVKLVKPGVRQLSDDLCLHAGARFVAGCAEALAKFPQPVGVARRVVFDRDDLPEE